MRTEYAFVENNIYKSGKNYRVRVSVGGERKAEYVSSLKKAKKLKREWLKEQKNYNPY